MVWLMFTLINQEVKRAPATLCPSKSHSFLPATPPTSEVPPLPKQCHKLGDISNPNLQTAMVKSEERVWWGGCSCSMCYFETERAYRIQAAKASFPASPALGPFQWEALQPSASASGHTHTILCLCLTATCCSVSSFWSMYRFCS